MKYLDLVVMKKNLKKRWSRLVAARSRAYGFGGISGDLPKSTSNGTRTERAVEIILDAERQYKQLYNDLVDAIQSVPDEYIRNIIFLKLAIHSDGKAAPPARDRSWIWVAAHIHSTEDAVKKLVYRLKW